MIVKLDSETNVDPNITSKFAVLTHTPSTVVPLLCQGFLSFSGLEAIAGNFELSVSVGGVSAEPEPQIIAFSAGTTAAVWTSQFPVPLNEEVILSVKSPNGGDSVGVTVVASLFDVAPDSEASLHIWHVDGANGADTNVGHSASDAFLTIQAAIDVAPAGDIIYIWPSTYNEDLAPSGGYSFIGKSKESCIIQGSAGNIAFSLNDNMIMKHLRVLGATGSADISKAVNIGSKDNIFIDDCHFEAMSTGLGVDALQMSSSHNIVVKNTTAKCAYDALWITACTAVIIDGCVIETDATVKVGPYYPRAVRIHGNSRAVIVKNSVIQLVTSYDVNGTVYAVEVGSGVVMDNCTIEAIQSHASNNFIIYGVYGAADSEAVLHNCIIRTSSVAGTAYDVGTVNNATAHLQLNNCQYTTVTSNNGVINDFSRDTNTNVDETLNILTGENPSGNILTDIDSKIDTIDSKIETIDTNIDTIDTNIDTIDTNVDETLNILTGENPSGNILTDIDSKIDTIDSKIDTIDTNVDTIDTNVDTIDSKIDIIDTNVDETLNILTGENPSGNILTDIDSKIDTIDTNVNTINTNVGTPADIDDGGATLADNIKKLADDSDGTVFDATDDSLNKISDNVIVEGNAPSLGD